jgi:hypothetical protein
MALATWPPLPVRVAAFGRSDLGDDRVWSLPARMLRKLSQSSRRVASSLSTAARCRPSRATVSAKACWAAPGSVLATQKPSGWLRWRAAR